MRPDVGVDERKGNNVNETTVSEARATGFDAPPAWKTALEYRAAFERANLFLSTPALRLLPKGDGHPVVVFPGFTAGDRSTDPLRNVLKNLGYRTYAWGNGVNIGPTAAIMEGIVRRLDRAFARDGQQVSLIGWSLGGIYARELGRAFPERVRQVITLGSPIQMTGADSSGASRMWEAMRRYHSSDFDHGQRDARKPLLQVPSSSIYTKTDGVVDWRASLIRRTVRSENIQVYGSHCGLGFNTSAMFAIADRLAQPAGEWTHFRAPMLLRGAFPVTDDLDLNRFPADIA